MSLASGHLLGGERSSVSNTKNPPLFHKKGDAILKWIEADEDIELTTDAGIVESSVE